MKNRNFKYLGFLLLVLLLAWLGFLLEKLKADDNYLPEQNIAAVDTLLKYYRRSCTDEISFKNNQNLCTEIAQKAANLVIKQNEERK